jgi:IclR family transcriptional regulator, KDG regulon repressor
VVASDATSLRRGLAILLAIEGEEVLGVPAPGVTRIAALIGTDKSQVSRSVKILAEHGLVDRDPETLGYRLGWRLLAMAGHSSRANLLNAAEPLLKRLVRETGERAHLSVLRGATVLTVLSEGSDRAVEAAGWVGRTVPLHCTATGRALLLDHTQAEVESLVGDLPFEGGTTKAPRDARRLYARIAASRERGFVLVDEEFEVGLVAVAAPVRDFGGRIVAALNVSAPRFRFAKELPRAGRQVRAAAAELSTALGWDARRQDDHGRAARGA